MKLKRWKFFQVFLFLYHLLKRVVLIFSLAFIIFVIILVLYDFVIFFKIMEKDLIKVRQFWRFIPDLLVFPQIQIPSEEFIEDIIVDFFRVVHLFARLNSNSPQCKLKLEK